MEDEIVVAVGVTIAHYRGFLDHQYSRAQVVLLKARLEDRSGSEYGALGEDSPAVDPPSQANLEALRVSSSRP